MIATCKRRIALLKLRIAESGHESIPSGLRAITALLVLRDKAIKPLLAAAQEITPTRGGQNPRAIDRHYQDLRLAMKRVFCRLGIAA